MYSDFENMKLNKPEKDLVGWAKEGYANATEDRIRQSYHWVAEGERKKEGFSGSYGGDSYIPVDTFREIDVPSVEPYEGKYDGDIDSILNSMLNLPTYQSPYDKDIDRLLNESKNIPDYVSKYQPYIDKTLTDIITRKPYQYNPDKDPSFQEFLKRAGMAGERAYEENIQGFATMSGGRVSSWAESAAKQAQESFNQMAQTSVEKFANNDFNKYAFNTEQTFKQMGMLQQLESTEIDRWSKTATHKLELLKTIQSMDTREYQKFRMGIEDKKYYANLLLELDNQDFKRYMYVSEQAYRRFNAEMKLYQEELRQNQFEWRSAMERTNMSGFVNNRDSIVLGLPAGTLSKDAREREEALEDWKTSVDYNLDIELEKMKIQHEYDKQIIDTKAKIEQQKRGSVSDFMENPFISDDVKIKLGIANLPTKVTSQMNSMLQSWYNVFEGDYYDMNADQRYMVIDGIFKELLEVGQSEAWGDYTQTAVQALYYQLQNLPQVQADYIKYGANQKEIMNTKDLSMIGADIKQGFLSGTSYYRIGAERERAFKKQLEDDLNASLERVKGFTFSNKKKPKLQDAKDDNKLGDTDLLKNLDLDINKKKKDKKKSRLPFNKDDNPLSDLGKL